MYSLVRYFTLPNVNETWWVMDSPLLTTFWKVLRNIKTVWWLTIGNEYFYQPWSKLQYQNTFTVHCRIHKPWFFNGIFRTPGSRNKICTHLTPFPLHQENTSVLPSRDILQLGITSREDNYVSPRTRPNRFGLEPPGKTQRTCCSIGLCRREWESSFPEKECVPWRYGMMDSRGPHVSVVRDCWRFTSGDSRTTDSYWSGGVGGVPRRMGTGQFSLDVPDSWSTECGH